MEAVRHPGFITNLENIYVLPNYKGVKLTWEEDLGPPTDRETVMILYSARYADMLTFI